MALREPTLKQGVQRAFLVAMEGKILSYTEPSAAALSALEPPSVEGFDWEEIARQIAEDPWEGFTGGYVEDMDLEREEDFFQEDFYDSEELSEDWDTSRAERPW